MPRHALLKIAINVLLCCLISHSKAGPSYSLGINQLKLVFKNVVVANTNNMFIYWNDVTSPDQPIQFGVLANVSTFGWASLAFNNRFSMSPARAVVAHTIGETPQPQITEYALSSSSSKGVNPSDSPVISDTAVEYSSDGGSVAFCFTLSPRDEPHLKLNDSTLLILAFGPRSSSEEILPKHDIIGQINVTVHSVPFPSTSDDNKDNSTISNGNVPKNNSVIVRLMPGALQNWIYTFGGKYRTELILTHAVLMIVAWLVLVPIGVISVSPSFRKWLMPSDHKTQHTQLHVIVITIALLFTIISLFIGWIFLGGHDTTHFAIGTLSFVLMVKQSSIGAIRRIMINSAQNPLQTWQDTKTVISKLKDWCKSNKIAIIKTHAWLGRLLWLLAIVNIYVGLSLYTSYGSWFAGLTIVMSLVGTALMVAGPMYGARWFKKHHQFEARKKKVQNDEISI